MRIHRVACIAGLGLFAMGCAQGCGGSIEQPFELVCLTYGRPDYPMGTLVHKRYEDGAWKELARSELTREAVILHPPPYPDGVFPFISVIEASGEKTSALWHWPLAGASEPQFQLPVTGRVVLLAAREPGNNRAVICYYAASQVNMVTAEYERRAVTLGANARCSLAVLYLDRPDPIKPVGVCQFALPAWLPNGHLAFIDRWDNLVRYNVDSAAFSILVPLVKSFSVSQDGKLCAVSQEGQLQFYTLEGEPEGDPIDSVSAPMLSPNGRYLACRHSDNDLWIRDLDSGEETEVGLGDPRNWSDDSRVLLFYGRRSDEQGHIRTFYRVVEAATGVSIEVPQDGLWVDAVLYP